MWQDSHKIKLPVFVFGTNNTDYVSVAYEDLRLENNVFLVDGQLEHRPALRRAHYSRKLSRFGHLPFKGCWAKADWRNVAVPKDERSVILFVECPESIELDYVRWIKRRYPNAFLCTYLLNTSASKILEPLIPSIVHEYDLTLTCSEEDAVRFGLTYWPNCYSKIEGLHSHQIETDLSFIGIDKGRYEFAKSVYEEAKSAGLVCDFIIQGDRNGRFRDEGFEWISQTMPYKTYLNRTLRSRCLLEIVAGNKNYCTYRTMEALMYGRHLITTNQAAINAPYYDSKNIHVIKSAEDAVRVVLEGLREYEPDESVAEYFSPVRLIKYLREVASAA